MANAPMYFSLKKIVPTIFCRYIKNVFVVKISLRLCVTLSLWEILHKMFSVKMESSLYVQFNTQNQLIVAGLLGLVSKTKTKLVNTKDRCVSKSVSKY